MHNRYLHWSAKGGVVIRLTVKNYANELQNDDSEACHCHNATLDRPMPIMKIVYNLLTKVSFKVLASILQKLGTLYQQPLWAKMKEQRLCFAKKKKKWLQTSLYEYKEKWIKKHRSLSYLQFSWVAKHSAFKLFGVKYTYLCRAIH